MAASMLTKLVSLQTLGYGKGPNLNKGMLTTFFGSDGSTPSEACIAMMWQVWTATVVSCKHCRGLISRQGHLSRACWPRLAETVP
jgi:hypothetical protein